MDASHHHDVQGKPRGGLHNVAPYYKNIQKGKFINFHL